MANHCQTPESFYARADKLENGCWEWQGATNGHGYGQLGYNGKRTTAHRLSYELSNGEIPAGVLVRHTCDNPPCCNPAHLILGTHLDNAADRVARGRNRSRAGAQSINPRYKTVTEKMADQYGTCGEGHILEPGNQRTTRDGATVCASCYHAERMEHESRPLTEAQISVIKTAAAAIEALLNTLPDNDRGKAASEIYMAVRSIMAREIRL